MKYTCLITTVVLMAILAKEVCCNDDNSTQPSPKPTKSPVTKSIRPIVRPTKPPKTTTVKSSPSVGVDIDTPATRVVAPKHPATKPHKTTTSRTTTTTTQLVDEDEAIGLRRVTERSIGPTTRVSTTKVWRISKQDRTTTKATTTTTTTSTVTPTTTVTTTASPSTTTKDELATSDDDGDNAIKDQQPSEATPEVTEDVKSTALTMADEQPIDPEVEDADVNSDNDGMVVHWTMEKDETETRPPKSSQSSTWKMEDAVIIHHDQDAIVSDVSSHDERPAATSDEESVNKVDELATPRTGPSKQQQTRSDRRPAAAAAAADSAAERVISPGAASFLLPLMLTIAVAVSSSAAAAVRNAGQVLVA